MVVGVCVCLPLPCLGSCSCAAVRLLAASPVVVRLELFSVCIFTIFSSSNVHRGLRRPHQQRGSVKLCFRVGSWCECVSCWSLVWSVFWNRLDVVRETDTIRKALRGNSRHRVFPGETRAPRSASLGRLGCPSVQLAIR